MKRRKRMPRNPAKHSGPISSPPGTLGRDIQAKIGDQLRALHDDIVSQGVPDRFVDLLARLDRANDSKDE